MKKFVSLALAALMLLGSAAGCGVSAGGGGASSSSGDIKGWFASPPETIDPTMNSSVDGATYIVHLFQGLFRYKWNGTGVELGDAESYTISDDGLIWTFKLRNDIKWSDGKNVTAYDYEYSWKRLCTPEVAAPYAEDLGVFLVNGLAALEGDESVDDIGVKALDDRTFEVRLDGPCPFFDQVAVFPVFYPVREDIIEANGDSWWTKPATYVCNGPFKMKSFSLDENLIIEPNGNFCDASKIVKKNITFVFLADEIVALSAIRANEIDIASGAPPDELGALEAEGLLDIRDQLGTYYLSFNTEQPPYDNPLVRKALALAIDREYICETVMQNTRVPATSMVGYGFQDADRSKDFRTVGGDFISLSYEDNKELAKQALAEAGYPNGEGFPTLEYMYNTSSAHKMIAEVLAKSWEEVLGIKVNLSVQEWGVFLETRRKGNFEVARNGWISDWNDPSSMLTIFVSGGGNNDGNYNNPQFDKFMSDSYATNDHSARTVALHGAEKVLMDDWGCAPIFFYKNSFMVKPELQDWYYTPLGYTLLQLAHK